MPDQVRNALCHVIQVHAPCTEEEAKMWFEQHMVRTKRYQQETWS